jgi:putative transposase
MYYERNLPHWHPAGRQIFLTWRLQGSLPKQIVERLRFGNHKAGQQFLRAERFLDRGSFGPLWLETTEIALLVERSICKGAQQLEQYQLLAYVVMPNHVHLLIAPAVPLARITAAIKGTTARHANALLRRTGEVFWQTESFDHWVRNPLESARIRQYIEQNPVKAGLVSSADQWPWSSATKK